MWNDVAPFYPDQLRGIPKTSESRGTEAILNALILANRDAYNGQLADDTRAAFANMWALQMRTPDMSGAWAWLNFQYEPWESTAAPYFGASLAALAVGTAPGQYAASGQIQDSVKRLREYLQHGFPNQSPFNQLMALWASTAMHGLLAADQQQTFIDAVSRQQQEDGGWSTASLGAWKRLDGSQLDTHSDGYATGLITLVLQRSGVSSPDPRVRKGLEWLKQNQNRDTGQWSASSLNKQRDPASDIGRFMSDAATGFAVLSLTFKDQRGDR